MKYILIILSALYLTGCASSKHTNRQYRQSDSTMVENLQAELRTMRTERDHFEARVKELETGTVEFDTTPCPAIPEIHCPGLNTDSVNKIINNLNNLYAGAMNKVKVAADGSMELSGRLKSYRYQNERQAELLADKERTIDSLQKLVSEKKVETSTVEKIVDKEVKRFQWWLLVVGIILGWLLKKYWTKLNPLNMFKTILPLSALFLTGCGRHRDGTSVWAEGLWVLPAVLSIASLWFFFVAWRASRSGSSKQIPGRGTVYSDENVKIWKVWAFWFGVAFAAATVVMFIVVNGEKG